MGARAASATRTTLASCAASAAAAGSRSIRRPPSAAARAPASCTTSPSATTDADMPSWIDAGHRGAGSRTAATSTATTSTRCTSASPAACSTSWRPREPGFTVDGPVEELGTKLILPPFLEPRREEIAARLTPLPDPRAVGLRPRRARAGPAPARRAGRGHERRPGDADVRQGRARRRRALRAPDEHVPRLGHGRRQLGLSRPRPAATTCTCRWRARGRTAR